MTKYHRPGTSKSRNLFLTFLEAGSPRSKSSRDGFWCAFPPWLADGHLSAVSLHGLSSVSGVPMGLEQHP